MVSVNRTAHVGLSTPAYILVTGRGLLGHHCTPAGQGLDGSAGGLGHRSATGGFGSLANKEGVSKNIKGLFRPSVPLVSIPPDVAPIACDAGLRRVHRRRNNARCQTSEKQKWRTAIS